jgi:hypothetical protein
VLCDDQADLKQSPQRRQRAPSSSSSHKSRAAIVNLTENRGDSPIALVFVFLLGYNFREVSSLLPRLNRITAPGEMVITGYRFEILL